MRRLAATSRATSTTPAPRTATHASSAIRSGFWPRGTSAKVRSSPTTIRPMVKGRFRAAAVPVARSCFDAGPLPARVCLVSTVLESDVLREQAGGPRHQRDGAGSQRAGLLDAHGEPDAGTGL